MKSCMKALALTSLCRRGVASGFLMASAMPVRGPISSRRTEVVADCGERRNGCREVRMEESCSSDTTSSSGGWEMCWGRVGRVGRACNNDIKTTNTNMLLYMYYLVYIYLVYSVSE